MIATLEVPIGRQGWMTDPTLRNADADMTPDSGPSSGWRTLFVSYRRRDSQGATGRLYDGLVRAFGAQSVFRDVAALVPGVEFDRAIAQALANCVVQLVVIGPRWVDSLQQSGGPSRDEAVDYVCLEVATAIQRGITVVPVLVDGASMPTAAELPPELHPLAKRQAHELTDRRWDYDLSVLLRHLAPFMQAAAPRWPRVERRVLVPFVLGCLALYAFAILWPVHTAATSFALDSPILREGLPSFGGAADGGLILLILGGVAWLLRVLAAKIQEAAASRFGVLLQDSRVLAASVGGLVGAAPPLIIGRPLFAVAVAAICVTLAAARSRLARLLTSPGRAAAACAAILAMLASALALDVWDDHQRQAGYDVALLLPPEGPGRAAEEIFRDFRSVLATALVGTTVAIEPQRLSKEQFDQFDFQRPQRLLAYKGPRGAARVFIRVHYELESDKKRLSLSVWPYLRPVSSQAVLQVADGWIPPELVGQSESRILALRAAFELIAFLSDRSQLRLGAAERQQVWRQLLVEYEQLLRLHPTDCAALSSEVGSLRRDVARPLASAELKKLLFAPCANAGAPATPEAHEQTARALWAATAAR